MSAYILITQIHLSPDTHNDTLHDLQCLRIMFMLSAARSTQVLVDRIACMAACRYADVDEVHMQICRAWGLRACRAKLRAVA